MNTCKPHIALRETTSKKPEKGLDQGDGSKSGDFIYVEGESVSVLLLEQNAGLDRARECGRGRWCLRSPCLNHRTCWFLHRKECQPEHTHETNTSAVQMALELAKLKDPLKFVLGDKSKRKELQNLLSGAGLLKDLLPIVHRMMSSLDNSKKPLSEDLVEVRMWCDEWIIRSTKEADKLHALPPDLQNVFCSHVYEVCKRDPKSPDTRRALAEVFKLPSIPPEEHQKPAGFLQNTEINIMMEEGDNRSDVKHKRYVVSKMYQEAEIPFFNSAVWPISARELASGFSELKDLPGLVVDRFIPLELRGLHLRVLQHLSRANFMHSMNEIATAVKQRGINGFQTDSQEQGYLHHFDVFRLTFLHVKPNGTKGLIASFQVNMRYTLQNMLFLSGNLVLLWEEGVQVKAENCFVAVVENEKDGVLALSPVDLLRCWQFFKPRAHFLLIQSQNFYLPTAASLSQLHKQESKVAENKEPDLLRALICGDAAKDPPIYLQHNPPFEIGCCVALRDGSESKQPALNDWPCRDWSEEAEKEISKTSDGEMALLDRTQMEALQHIMRNRVAVVQGTPGTGKSFVGSKFLQMLLFNETELEIGPIVVMAYTHHALERSFESLIPFAERYGVKIGLLGFTKNEDLKPYNIHMKHQKSKYINALFEVGREIDAIKSYNTVDMQAEEKILDVMENYMDLQTYNVWRQVSRMHQESWFRVQWEYKELIKQVSEELCILIPDSLEDIEKMLLVLNTNQWHGEVDIMPFLKKHFPSRVNKHCNKIRNSLMKITALKRKVPLKCLIDAAVKNVEKCFSLLNDGENTNILAECLETFVRELEKLHDMKRSMPAVYIPPMEWWRMEGMPHGHTLPPLADTTSAESERVEDTNKTHAVAPYLQEFKREVEERRRQERDLDDDIEEVDEKNQVTYLSLPTKKERDVWARDACNSIANNPPSEERSELLSVLLQEKIYSLQEMLNTLVAKINEETEVLKEEEAAMNASVLKEYTVIGATSAKLMLSVEAIQRCGASVLVVEEAAEVLESHLLACITASMQHVVLIGDHKQLKPKVNEYLLEREKNLAVSTMERLVLCGLPCVTITMQRRMVLEISDLTKPYYRRSNVAGDKSVIIEDHPRTQRIPPPFGVCHEDGTPIRLFFLSHDGQGERAEGVCDTLMSPENRFEARIAACIAHYLVSVNKGNNITILTPYTGQHLAVLKELDSLRVLRRSEVIEGDPKNVFEKGVRLSTVDSYQGEEDDIIILSLVRTAKHGFLRLDNRACVALSRSRSALYVVGCGTLLSGASALWANLERQCGERKSIGTRFPARCNRHPARDLSFGSAKEYKEHLTYCPTPCGAELECGHMCERLCHGEREHPPCQNKCNRVGQLCIPPRPCKHPCEKTCCGKCGDCMVLVDYTFPDCGHCIKLHCHQLENVAPCTTICTTEADCGHEVEAECAEHVNHTSFRKCKENCSVRMSCGHICTRKCHHGDDEDHKREFSKCTRTQLSKAPCGHKVEHPCNEKNIASLCKARCERSLASSRLPGEKSICQLKCAHQGPCDYKEKITVKLPCGHTSDTFASASKDPPPYCSARCNATLECGHQCSGNCSLCSQRKFHSDCREPGKTLVCGHNSNLGCTAIVSTCEELCAFYCGHGKPCNELSKKAQHKCSECPSRVCKELCQWQCPHGKCSKKCSEPCEFEVTEDNSVALSSGCWRRCERNLSCGHRCCGLCGERCPPFCRECYRAGNKKALALAERVVTYTEDKELEILRTDNSVETQSLVELPCCQVIFVAKELYDLFARKAKGKGIMALTCPHCRAMVLPNAFRHADVFVKERLLQVSHIVNQVHDASKEKTYHGVSEVITYIQEELKFSNTEDLIKAVKQARQGVAIRNDKDATKDNLKIVWYIFENSCNNLGLEKKWISLLRYHIEVLENALGKLRKNDLRIAQNANLLAEAALRFTIMDHAVFESVRGCSLPERFCRENLKQLVKANGNLARSFPSAEAGDGVQCFCERMEWTYLIYQIKPCSALTMHPFEYICSIGKLFAKRGVRPDEVDRSMTLKQVINDELKRTMNLSKANSVIEAFDLSTDHWYEGA